MSRAWETARMQGTRWVSRYVSRLTPQGELGCVAQVFVDVDGAVKWQNQDLFTSTPGYYGAGVKSGTNWRGAKSEADAKRASLRSCGLRLRFPPAGTT